MGTYNGLIEFSCPSVTKNEGLRTCWHHIYSLINVCHEFQTHAIESSIPVIRELWFADIMVISDLFTIVIRRYNT
jgi:hypothetical protein